MDWTVTRCRCFARNAHSALSASFCGQATVGWHGLLCTGRDNRIQGAFTGQYTRTIVVNYSSGHSDRVLGSDASCQSAEFQV